MKTSLPRIVVIGMGGHAKVIIDLIRSIDRFELYGAVDNRKSPPASYGVPVLGGDEVLPDLLAAGIQHLAIAVGDNARRMALSHAAVEMGFNLPALVAPSAYVAPTASLGSGAVVFANSVVQSDAVIGSMSIVNSGAIVEHDCKVGDAAHVAPGAILCGGVSVGRLSLIGAGARIPPGLTIAEETTIGAGAVVTGSIAVKGLYVGVPAKAINRSQP